MLCRVALQGFAQAERDSLASFLREAGRREPGYRPVHRGAEADVILADGDSPQAIADVVGAARLATTLFVGERRPPQAQWHLDRPIDPARLLRGLDAIVAQPGFGATTAAESEADASHAQAQAHVKAAARRARLAALATARPEAAVPPDVLVLDADDITRDHLCALLEHFGFCAYPARNRSQALWLLETRAFAAAFLDIAFDGDVAGAGAELCQRVKKATHARPEATTALFIVARQAQPTDRVRATLAGCDALLLKPLGRGDVARALDACNVVLPSDQRRR